MYPKYELYQGLFPATKGDMIFFLPADETGEGWGLIVW
jgi:hypothetical protein